ncbi:MLP-like protein 423 [Hibiscus trionum]|uniref:MLP-like protein 423 n=1 Tax=Hibiscus trionum TaxID=183268 RepID=A0A9W7MWF7_HIBTR|nr:MLP-like protein 423 [Hibiscus trionum]
MGVFTHEMEVTAPIPPAKAFKATVLDFDTLFPKVAPFAIKSVQVLEGNGGPGTIKKVTFAQGWGPSYLKQKVDELDTDNLSYTYTVFEGDVLKNVLEKISYENKFVAGPNGGTICMRTTKFYPVGDIEIKEETIKEGMVKQAQVFKAIEDYLVANPDA